MSTWVIFIWVHGGSISWHKYVIEQDHLQYKPGSRGEWGPIISFKGIHPLT